MVRTTLFFPLVCILVYLEGFVCFLGEPMLHIYFGVGAEVRGAFLQNFDAMAVAAVGGVAAAVAASSGGGYWVVTGVFGGGSFVWDDVSAGWSCRAVGAGGLLDCRDCELGALPLVPLFYSLHVIVRIALFRNPSLLGLNV